MGGSSHSIHSYNPFSTMVFPYTDNNDDYLVSQTRDDMKEYNMTEYIAENLSVWHMTAKAGPLLHDIGERFSFDVFEAIQHFWHRHIQRAASALDPSCIHAGSALDPRWILASPSVEQYHPAHIQGSKKDILLHFYSSSSSHCLYLCRDEVLQLLEMDIVWQRSRSARLVHRLGDSSIAS